MREPKRVTHYEISEKNKKVRQILVIVLLAIGFVSIGVGFMSLLNRESGWQEIEVVSTDPNCSEDFLLQYNLSGSGAEATALYKQISAIYTEACEKTYELFNVYVSSESYENVYDINHNVNNTITVDPLLYQAFEKLEGTRYLYLGPAYAHYSNLILNTSDEYVQELDPALDDESRELVSRMAAFAASETDVELQLLGNSQVRLFVSDAYLAFAEENEIENFIDFRYMTNAFIIDSIADSLRENGYTRGFLSSCDGYTRNLDSENIYAFNIFHRVENTVYTAGVLQYQGPVSMVFLKDFQVVASDAYYRDSGDHVVHTYVDIADGMYRTSTPNLVGYSYDKSCVDVLLAMLPSFIGEEFSVPQGIYSVWCEDNTVCYNDAAVSITELLSDDSLTYTARLQN